MSKKEKRYNLNEVNYTLGKCQLFPEKNILLKGHEEIKIEPKVLEVLMCLINNYGQTVSKSFIMKTVWGDTIVTEHSLSKAISKIRKLLKDVNGESKIIETVSKKGYRLLICPVKINDVINNKIELDKNNKTQNKIHLISYISLTLSICSFCFYYISFHK